MIKSIITTGVLVFGTASAEVIIDQIGPMDGSALGLTLSSNQYFEAKYTSFDVAVIENFTLLEQREITEIEVVIDGWSGFVDPSSITSYEVNIYSDSEAASQSLTGNIATQLVDVSDVTLSSEWYGEGYLISVPVQLNLPSGTYWCSVIPSNNFTDDGQVGLYSSTLGDGVLSMQANPGEGLDFGVIRKLNFECALRIHDNIVVDPCSVPLQTCSEDINGDGFVTISDLLEIIIQWGDCGDGTYRPSADCAPLPNGDCCVNIADILVVVAAWDSECTPHGGCCLPEGSCDAPVTEQFCLLNSGVYFGDDTTCETQDCFSGACCLDDVNCLHSSQDLCSELGGFFKGDGSDCLLVDCSQLATGDECQDSIEVSMGKTPFSTTRMTPSQPQPDDSFCEFSNLDWADSPDIWFSFTATESNSFMFSLCDIDSYDTSMVLYEGDCSTQVSCSGDEIIQEGCQQYYSELTYELEEYETYFIRVGGWQATTGTGTLTISLLPPPVPGACCFTDGTCFELLAVECEVFRGTFLGIETLCETVDCVILEGDECKDAPEVYIGSHSFSTQSATPSTPFPSDLMCPDSYLEWGVSNPDIWLLWVATDNGTAIFTTCDAESFDTSMVLYEDSCDMQVACNGDAEPDGACQNYYSSITYEVTAGTSYFIRLGGWENNSGDGTISISLDGENDVAACCYLGDCYEDQSELACMDMNGVWQEGETCDSFNCEDVLCHSATFTQTPHDPADNWNAGSSTIDSSLSPQFARAEYVNVAAINTITVWGLQAYFNDESQWVPCETDYLFTVRSYEDLKGFPGQISREAQQTTATRTGTGTLYAGVYELMQWEMEFTDMNVEHIGIQSESDGLDCWFLWLSSGEGNYSSSVNTGNGWTNESFDLSICIE